jgi:hypothetical protein
MVMECPRSLGDGAVAVGWRSLAASGENHQHHSPSVRQRDQAGIVGDATD